MSLTILNSDELQNLEHRMAVRYGEDALMRRAGLEAANFIEKRTEGFKATFIAGSGNNGGDALAAACVLKKRGWDVVVVMPKAPATELAKTMLEEWKAMGGEVESDPYQTRKADVVVDGLFGTGLKKPITGELLDCVLWFNERSAFKVSLDVPSGLDFMTGNWVGGSYPGCRADATITFLSMKAGLFINEGVDAAGDVVLSELDVSVPLSSIGLIEPSDFKHVTQPRLNFAHKGHFGRVLVSGGSAGRLGALVLASRAAVVMGAGTVTAECFDESASMIDMLYPEVMWTRSAVDSDFSVTVLGPGLGDGEAAKARVKTALASEKPLVLDADALNIIASDISLQDDLLARRAVTVLTPHEMEAARLLRRDVKDVSIDRISAARELAVQSGAIVVLKGAGTVVALRSALTWVNPTGSSMLATGGSGDVLAGMIGSFLAQKFDVMESVLGAVYLHGLSCDGRYAGFRASDIAVNAASILEELREMADE